MFRNEFRQGRIENIFQIAVVAHHLINYTRKSVATGRLHACHFAPEFVRSHSLLESRAACFPDDRVRVRTGVEKLG